MLRHIPYNDTITLILFASLCLIAILKFAYSKRLAIYFNVLFSSRYFNTYSKDIKFFDRFSITLYFIFISSITLFIYAFLPQAHLNFHGVGFKLLLFALIFLGFAIKFSFELILGKILNIEKPLKLYLFKKISIRHFFGIALIPVIAFLYYNKLLVTPYANYVLIAMVIMYLLSYIFIVKSFLGLIKQNWFYFILYLCALEILPVIILYKSLV